MSHHKNEPPQKRFKMDPKYNLPHELAIGNSNWTDHHGGGGGLRRSGAGLGVNVVGEPNISSTQAPGQGGPQMNGSTDVNTGVNQGGGGMIGARNNNTFSGGATISQGGYGSASNNAGTGERNWRDSVTADERKLLINKFVLALIPNPDPITMADSRFCSLVDYAKKFERVKYETAKSRTEYYILLAEKIYMLKKETEDRRIKRMERSQQQGSDGEPGQTGQNMVGIRGHHTGGNLLAMQQQQHIIQLPQQQKGDFLIVPPGPSPNSGMVVIQTSTSESIVVPSPDSSPYGIQVIPVSPIPGQQQQFMAAYKCNIRY